MKHILSILFFLSFFSYAQELTSDEYKMNTIKIIHVEDNEIYRVGLEGMANDYFKKSVKGEDITELKLSDKSENIRCRGVFLRDEYFYSVSTRDDFDKTDFILKKIDKDLKVIEETVVFSESTTGKSNKAEVFFEHNKNGFVLIRNFTKRIAVSLDSYIYEFSTGNMHSSKIEFTSRQVMKLLDFDFSEQLKVALILDADQSIGTLKTKQLKQLESYLVYVEPGKEISELKLTEDKKYDIRSFNLTFHKEELLVANLNFHNPSNILAGYTVKKYSLNQANELHADYNIYFEFNDFASREEWGPILEEVQKKHEKYKDGKSMGYEPFGALEITDLFVRNNSAILIVREVFYVKDHEQSHSGPSISLGGNAGKNQSTAYNSASTLTKRFKEFQITKLDLDANEIVWWNRIYNVPYTNGSKYTTEIAHNNSFWNDKRHNSRMRIYYPYINDNKIVLLYPTYQALYEENGELKNELINQRAFMSMAYSSYGLIGQSEIDIENGEIENSLLTKKIDGAGSVFSMKVINIEGFFVTDDKVIIPVENVIKKSSVLKVENK